MHQIQSNRGKAMKLSNDDYILFCELKTRATPNAMFERSLVKLINHLVNYESEAENKLNELRLQVADHAVSNCCYDASMVPTDEEASELNHVKKILREKFSYDFIPVIH